jgi:intergrase/recombinase
MKTARRSQKRVSLPIHLTLFDMLSLCPENKRRGYVMPSIAARYQSFHSALSKDVAKLFQSVGITTTTETEGVGRNRADCGYHSLRHTFVSLCASGGVPQSVVQSLVGHGSPAMTQHYTHIGLQTAQNAIALLPHVAGKKGVEKKNDAVLKEMKKQLTGLTDKGLKTLVASAEKEIQKREKVKKSEPIDVKEITKTEKVS